MQIYLNYQIIQFALKQFHSHLTKIILSKKLQAAYNC